MKRPVLILAIVLIAIGAFGLVALNAWQAGLFYANNAQPWGYGMTGPGMMNGMRGYSGYGYNTPPSIAPITLDEAVIRAQTYVAPFNNADLTVAEEIGRAHV